MSVRARAFAALLLLGAGDVAAQTAPQKKDPAARKPRSVIFAVLGAVTGAAVSGMYAFTEHENSSPGQCTSGTCVLTVASVSGALVGLMIGREFDQLHTLRYRGGAPLFPRIDAVGLNSEAFVVAVRDTLIAVGGRSGVQMVANNASLKVTERRANGIRGISAVDIVPGSGSIALGSPSGFYLYPPRSGPGMLLREGETTALVAAADRIYFATGSRIEVAPASADTLRTWPGIDIGTRIVGLAYDEPGAVLWAVSDSSLLAFRPEGDSLISVTSVRLPGRARTIMAADKHVAVALGEEGVVLYNASDAAAPKEHGRWKGARFVYSASIANDRVFAAGGLDGVYVLTRTVDGLETMGLASELGFATLLVTRGPYTFLVDRNTNSLRRFTSAF